MTEFFNNIGQTFNGVLPTILQSFFLIFIMSATYKLCFSKLNYNYKFNVTLAIIAFTTTVFLVMIKDTNVGLGIIGILSLVRFRTTIRDTRDIAFIFWAVLIGLGCATGHFVHALIGSIVLALFLLLTSRIRSKNNYLLVIRGENIDPEFITNYLKYKNKSFKTNAVNVIGNNYELVYDIKLKTEEQLQLVDEISRGCQGVNSVNILSPSAEVM